MNKEDVIELLWPKVKLVRTEKGYTQDKMSEVLGISKKTLVQIEKDRLQPGWTLIAAMCAIFRQSEILRAALGGDPVDVIEVVSHSHVNSVKEKTWGGHVWWRELKREGTYRLQQNLISQHYRILNNNDYRVYSSFDEKEARERLTELAEK
ncbi:helix-turn-helix transcriptional regulator [Fictibacillus aquaticus]|uniref:Transcriptional regulator n=1 Tax=Fictibacillus aquaticus TaxID=2021314 RepID=A0A235FDW1_9BACL|nr:helix-turn-helix domain-containing protein [Fictibacillus aquaticus]OYD59590.1 transcriptional regulator [Fictibacillus aquaticus]